MSPREFWNLAGRAGRIGHDAVGVVGLAEGKNRSDLVNFVSRSTGALVSRLVTLLDELAEQGQLNQLTNVLWQEQWDDFRCYIAHLWAEKKNLDAVLADTDQLLRQTYGYTTLRNNPAQREKADALLAATQNYARELAQHPGRAELADSTGFSPEGVAKAMAGMRNLEDNLTTADWAPESLFGEGGKMADLFGVMLNVPQLKKPLEEVGGEGFDHTRLSDVTRDWVNGKGIDAIAQDYFSR
ncbi:MAG: DEAD/DEAH box helicase, partial [Bacteroidota bacterium]